MNTTTLEASDVINVTNTQSALIIESYTSQVVLPIIYTVVCILGLFGNGAVIYIMNLKVQQKSITDEYVINLAIADFIFLSMLPFWTTENILNRRWIFGRPMCKLTSGSTLIHMYASVLFLTAMAIDRMVAVVLYRTCGNFRSRRSAKIGSRIIWIASIFLSVPSFFFRDVMPHENPDFVQCKWTFDFDNAVHTSIFILHLISRSILGFGLPFVIIAVCYCTIAIFLKTRKTTGRLTSKRQDRATTMVLVVIGVFLLCWLPNQISNAAYSLRALELISQPSVYRKKVYYFIHMFGTCLAWAHSCVNPILYVFVRKDLKEKVIELLHIGKCCCNSKNSHLARSQCDTSITFSPGARTGVSELEIATGE